MVLFLLQSNKKTMIQLFEIYHSKKKYIQMRSQEKERTSPEAGPDK
jgi:hypothetical protein